ncbi:MotA/TolQ/ExbB proton channel family protein [Telmatospirillum siberiense]|uniref:Biopolymer transport protein ExbB n=1 Tax=Telmatospirillum siberiense TaxID=382514 RepID=A0A2N3PPX6_9PROT|nr:MotA/TolQ/ExbB proton channel family protein [Telmatospirillum siberiense]PKU22459.1 biopolymer transporter ExbB [Telmatospirillum siberiense]
MSRFPFFPALRLVSTLALIMAVVSAVPIATAADPVSFVAGPAATAMATNPYGFDALWAQGDMVARGTLIILAVMSMSTWYVLILKLAEQRRLQARARAANRTFWTARSLSEGVKSLSPDSPFLFLASSGLDAVERRDGSLFEKVDSATRIGMAVQRAVEQITGGLQSGLAVLATVGSTAPFIGLFGTVWGIYHALTAIGIAGQASIDKVAGPVGEALIMTAIGLVVAVPAVLGYNWLVRRNRSCIEAVRNFSADLQAVLMAEGNAASLPARRAMPSVRVG